MNHGKSCDIIVSAVDQAEPHSHALSLIGYGGNVSMQGNVSVAYSRTCGTVNNEAFPHKTSFS